MEPQLAKPVSHAYEQSVMENTPPPAEEMGYRQAGSVQLVRAGASHYGIFAEEIAAIVPWKEPAPLPQAPRTVLGIVSIQGRMLTVLDLKWLGEDASSAEVSAPLTHLISLRGDEQLALAVDRVGATIEIEKGDIDEITPHGSPLVLRVIDHEGLEINILNLKELFAICMQGRERRRRRF